MTELIYAISTPIHVAAGIGAVILAPIAMAVQKGGDAHRRWGRIYYWCMAVVFVTTLTMLMHRPNMFLFAVGVLSFYSAFAADRVLRMKRPLVNGPKPLDWAAAIGALITGIALVIWGATALFSGNNPYGAFAILALIFGVLISQNSSSDLRRFRNPPTDKRFWWYFHMNAMIGSYMGAVTAFMVQTVTGWILAVPAIASFYWLPWVLPVAIGVPLSMLWEQRYRRQFAQAATKAKAAKATTAELA